MSERFSADPTRIVMGKAAAGFESEKWAVLDSNQRPWD
jgi:hypothetical protein